MQTQSTTQTETATMSRDIEATVDHEQFLTFMLAGEEYGVDILSVQEIKGWDTATPLPNTPDYIKGVINLRGTIVPIVDLRLCFGIDAADYGTTTVVIMLKVSQGSATRVVGVVVDAVSDVYNIARGDIQPTPSFGRELRLEFLRGISTVQQKMVLILDIEKLLNIDELVDVVDTGDARA